jgi:ribosomal protein L37AE/L43A
VRAAGGRCSATTSRRSARPAEPRRATPSIRSRRWAGGGAPPSARRLGVSSAGARWTATRSSAPPAEAPPRRFEADSYYPPGPGCTDTGQGQGAWHQLWGSAPRRVLSFHRRDRLRAGGLPEISPPCPDLRGGGPKEEVGRPKGPTAGPARIALAVGLPVQPRARARVAFPQAFPQVVHRPRSCYGGKRGDEERPRAASRGAAVTAVPQLPPARPDASAPPEIPSPGRQARAGSPTKAPAKPPGHHQEQFRCPNPQCGRSFTRNVRLGIWAACPSCGTRAYGMAVLQDLAAGAAARASAPRPKRDRKAPSPPAAPTSAPAHQAAVIGAFQLEPRAPARARSRSVPVGPAVPAPAPAAAAVPSRPRGFLRALLGDGEM